MARFRSKNPGKGNMKDADGGGKRHTPGWRGRKKEHSARRLESRSFKAPLCVPLFKDHCHRHLIFCLDVCELFKGPTCDVLQSNVRSLRFLINDKTFLCSYFIWISIFLSRLIKFVVEKRMLVVFVYMYISFWKVLYTNVKVNGVTVWSCFHCRKILNCY